MAPGTVSRRGSGALVEPSHRVAHARDLVPARGTDRKRRALDRLTQGPPQQRRKGHQIVPDAA